MWKSRLIGYTIGDEAETFGWKQYSSYGGVAVALSKNCFGETCRSFFGPKLVVWKTEKGASDNLRYGGETHTKVIPVYLSDAELQDDVMKEIGRNAEKLKKAWIALFSAEVRKNEERS